MLDLVFFAERCSDLKFRFKFFLWLLPRRIVVFTGMPLTRQPFGITLLECKVCLKLGRSNCGIYQYINVSPTSRRSPLRPCIPKFPIASFLFICIFPLVYKLAFSYILPGCRIIHSVYYNSLHTSLHLYIASIIK